MNRIAPLALFLLPLLAACGGAPEEETYAVRGVFLGTRFEGEAATLDHEAIPGLMEAMRMDFRLEDPAEAAALRPGTKVQFELAVGDEGVRARHFVPLPDTTALQLAPSATPAQP